MLTHRIVDRSSIWINMRLMGGILRVWYFEICVDLALMYFYLNLQFDLNMPQETRLISSNGVALHMHGASEKSKLGC